MSSFFNIENEKRFERPKLPGITVGIVSEIGTKGDDLGKVKVKLLNMENSNYETDFIRVMTPLTSSMRFIPEIGDEVIVAFCEGSMDQPYVLGCLHKANVQQPKTDNSSGTVVKPENNNIKTIKTRSGHEITFADYEAKDKAGQDKSNGCIYINSAGGLTVSLDDANNKISLSAESPNGEYNEVIIDANEGTISIEASKKIELCVAESKIEIGEIISAIDNTKRQKSSINIKAQNKVNLTGTGAISTKSSTFEVDSNTSLELKSNGKTELKGANTTINGTATVKIN